MHDFAEGLTSNELHILFFPVYCKMQGLTIKLFNIFWVHLLAFKIEWHFRGPMYQFQVPVAFLINTKGIHLPQKFDGLWSTLVLLHDLKQEICEFRGGCDSFFI